MNSLYIKHIHIYEFHGSMPKYFLKKNKYFKRSLTNFRRKIRILYDDKKMNFNGKTRPNLFMKFEPNLFLNDTQTDESSTKFIEGPLF